VLNPYFIFDLPVAHTFGGMKVGRWEASWRNQVPLVASTGALLM
jgi:hypothetical protein